MIRELTNIGVLAFCFAGAALAPAAGERFGFADLQFFGDTFIPKHVLKATASTKDDPRLFNKIRPLLDSAHYNIVNLEGTVTEGFVPYELKSYSLRMPLAVISLLSTANIHAVNLANNHVMDYGTIGLFDTKRVLEKNRMISFGVGETLAAAATPAVFSTRAGAACVIGYSKSLPTSFWAKKSRAGTASLSFSATRSHVKKISSACHYTIVFLHWGAEREVAPKQYQQKLARLVIDAGADAVIGHHPHVLQGIEIYKKRPIFYSIGNFAFGSRPVGETQSGMVIRMIFSKKAQGIKYEIMALNVNNKLVDYEPAFLTPSEIDPISGLLPKGHRCKKRSLLWECRF